MRSHEEGLFTDTDRWRLVCQAAEKLHQLMKPYRRNRWFDFEDVRTEGLVHRVLWRCEAKGLQCLITASNYDLGNSPSIKAEFRECCTDQSDTPPLPKSPKPFVIRIGLTEEPRQGPTISRVASDLAKLCDTTADSARRVIQRVRARNPERGSQEWWIDPQKTPVHYTKFVFHESHG